MSGGQRIARSAAASLFGQLLPLLAALVTMPLVVQGLGLARFGILSIVWSVLGHFSVFDLGLGRAATRSVAVALGQGRPERVRVVLGTACLAQLVLGVLGGAAVIALAPWLAEQALSMDGTPAEASVLAEVARASIILIGLSVPLVLIEGTLRGGLEAHQRFDLVNRVRIPVSLGGQLIPWIGAAAGLELPLIVGLLVAVRGLGLLGYRRQLVRLLGADGLRLTASRSVLRELWSFGSWAAVSCAIGPVLGYLERFLIASMLSVGALAFYALPMEALSRLLVIPSSLAAALFPALGEVGQRKPAAAARIYQDATRILLLLGLPLAAVGWAWAGPGLAWWAGEEFATKGLGLTRVLILVVLLNALALVPFSVVQGLGRPAWKARLDLFELPLFALAAWWGIGTLGLLGAALAKLLVTIVDFTALHAFAMRLTGADRRDWTTNVARPVLPVAAAALLLSTHPLAALLGLVPCAYLAVRTGLTPAERRGISHQFSRVALSSRRAAQPEPKPLP